MAKEKTKYKLAVERALLHEEQLDLIYNTVTDVIYMIEVLPGMKFKFISVNLSFLRVTGLKDHEVIGKHIEEVIPSMSIDLVLNKYHEAIEKATPVSWQETSVYPSGTKYGEVTVTPVFNKKGKCVRLVGSVHDITDKTEQDIALNQVNLERDEIIVQLLNRKRELEQYTYVISHNLRAPIVNILGLVNILKSFDIDKGAFEIINDLSESVEKLDSVIIDLNTILQGGEQNTERKQLVSIQGLVDDISLSIADIIKNEKAVITCHCENLSDIYSIRSHMYSIFYNLIFNAIKYRQTDKRPLINIECMKNGDDLVITFSDNGKGIDLTKYGDQLFRFYKRFDTSVTGKGLGLFLVKRHVEDLEGSITIKSELNQGTQFVISLPLHREDRLT